MKALSTGLCTLAILLFVSSLRPLQAQTAAAEAAPFGYNVTKEITLAGTVSSVLVKAAPGMIVGWHLLLATPAGPVDASLGRFGLRGAGAVSVAAGQQIEATGVMKTHMDKSFFLVRTLKVGGKVYTIRNEHGFPMSPQTRERSGQKTGGKGESL